MELESLLGLIGLARRAGKLAGWALSAWPAVRASWRLARR